jgi:hypothetical protein
MTMRGKDKRKEESGIIVGKPDVDPEAPSHVSGVHEGNWPAGARHGKNASRKDEATTGSPRRSTGVAWSARAVIDPRMPQLTPP